MNLDINKIKQSQEQNKNKKEQGQQDYQKKTYAFASRVLAMVNDMEMDHSEMDAALTELLENYDEPEITCVMKFFVDGLKMYEPEQSCIVSFQGVKFEYGNDYTTIYPDSALSENLGEELKQLDMDNLACKKQFLNDALNSIVPDIQEKFLKDLKEYGLTGVKAIFPPTVCLSSVTTIKSNMIRFTYTFNNPLMGRMERFKRRLNS